MSSHAATSSTPLAENDSEPFERVRSTLNELDRLINDSTFAVESVPVRMMIRQLAQSADRAEHLHSDLVKRSQTLSLAQAEAIVRSAEIIDELERTKQELIEARRESERHQAERLTLLRGVFENAREGVVILDSAARILEVNPEFAAITGWDQERLIGSDLEQVLDWTFLEYRVAWEMALSGQAWSGRITISRRHQLETRTYLLSLSPVQGNNQTKNIIALFSDVTDIELTQQRLQKQALHDQLTGLPNRLYYREQIQRMIKSNDHRQTRFAVCFIDLDDFKSVNDSLGHSAGDDLIIEVARRIQRSAGESCFVSRFGGDEFAILIPDTDLDLCRISSVTDDVLQAVRSPVQLGDIEVRVRASLGIAEFPVDGSDPDELMQNADVAMYAAKKNGRNQIRRFSREMKHEVNRRNFIKRCLQDVILGNELSIAYQPVVDFRTGELHSHEALARWQTASGEYISPGEFIPIAEQSGLISQLGDAILARVCQQLSQWQCRGTRPQQVAINLSPRQLRKTSFLSRIQEIVEASNVRPEWITLEVTETAVMDDVETSLRVLDGLAKMGFRLALDDFGTGHSSLSYLQRLNIHILKIDRSFVVDLERDARAVAIVESVIRLGQGRGLEIIAEGIETQTQWDLLRDMGCNFGQGYLIARPMPAHLAEHWGLRELVYP